MSKRDFGSMRKFAKLTVSEVIDFFHTDCENGLSLIAANNLLNTYGLNKLPEEQKDHIVIRYLEQFKEPLILLLLGSACLSVFVGQYDDAFSIAAAVIIVGSVAFYQEYKSEQSLEALNNLVPPSCNVFRNGVLQHILAEELVPGDLIQIHTGDRVPADARIIYNSGLCVDESCLTGESEPKEKGSDPLPDLSDNPEIPSCNNLVFMGTLICCGHAKAVVLSTGIETEFGKTSQELKDTENRRSPLQIKMDDLGRNLSIFSMGIIVLIGIIGMVRGKSFLAMFNIGVSLAVAAIPEGLPICVTVTLALGVMRMAKKNAIVKRLPAVEALGCADFICTDKTGTLTQNKMKVISAFCPGMDDLVHLEEDNEVDDNSGASLKNSLKLKYCSSVIAVDQFKCFVKLFDAACLCNNASLSSEGKITGQPTEGAILIASSRMGIPDRRSRLKRSRELNFSSETKYMEVSYGGDVESRGEVRYLKGALEVLLPQCVTYLNASGDLALLSPSVIELINQYSEEMAKGGLRVIAVAFGTKPNQFTLSGIIGLQDPLRDGVVEAVHRIRLSGARVMMITGDSETTALAIAKQAGIYDATQTDNKVVLSGQEIESLMAQGDEALASTIEQVAVCYRTTPRHKLYIVRALQLRSHVVALSGDGVNDAPALKAADIGVAMGSGTDVAKEASAMIITDDDFSTIVSAIEEGKSIFYNIKNFLTFQLSTSFAALSLVALNNMVGRPNPLNPMQILWINIIMDGPLAQSLGVELVDSNVVKRPPRKRNEDIITKPLLLRAITSAILILCGTMYVFVHEMEDGVISSRDLTMTFTTFVMFDMFNAYSCRNNYRSAGEISVSSNPAFLLALGFSLIGQMLVVYFPPLQKVFRTVPLSFIDMVFIICLASTMLCLDYVRKKFAANWFTEITQEESKSMKSKKGSEGSFGTNVFKV